MTWRRVLGEGAGAFARAGELSDVELRRWIVDELTGHGLADARREEWLVDVVRRVWDVCDASVRNRIGVVLVNELVTRFDTADAAPGGPGESERRAMHELLDCFVYLRVAEPPLERLRRGTRVGWAAPVTTTLMAPHPLKQAFARAWLACEPVRGRQLRQLIADPALTSVALGSLIDDLSLSVEYLPEALAVWGAGGGALSLHLRVLKERHGALALREALSQALLDEGQREVVRRTLRDLRIEVSFDKLLFPESGLLAGGGS